MTTSPRVHRRWLAAAFLIVLLAVLLMGLFGARRGEDSPAAQPPRPVAPTPLGSQALSDTLLSNTSLSSTLLSGTALPSTTLPSTLLSSTVDAAYIIDFTVAPPLIDRRSDQEAILTGPVLRNPSLAPSGLSYTLTIVIAGGPAQDQQFPLPPQAGRGQARFVDNLQPQLGNEGGLTVLPIQLLGVVGTAFGDPAQGQGVNYYRSPSTQALVSLTVGERFVLLNARYTLTGIDMALSADTCDPARGAAEPNNYACGGAFIDRVTLLGNGGNVITPDDRDQVNVVGDVLRAHFTDANGDGHPDKIEDRRVAAQATRGNVTVFHPGSLGPQLQLRFDDAAKGLDDDPDGYHDFDATAVGMGLASGITFDLVRLPPPPAPTPDPNQTAVRGLLFGDANGNGVQDQDESALALPLLVSTTLDLYSLQNPTVPLRIMTSTLHVNAQSRGTYQLAGLQAGTPYRLEALVPLPPAPGGEALNPLRLLRTFTPTRAGPNQVAMGVWPVELASAPAVSRTLLLPDLTPLTRLTFPPGTAPALKAEVEKDYPGMEQWYLDSKSQPGRLLLRFGSMAVNLGRGPLHIVGGAEVDGVRPVYQRLYTPAGSYVQRLVNEFVFHTSHDHVHVESFEQYNLREVTSDRIVASNPKISFCLTDVLWPLAPDLTQAAPIATVPMGWTCGVVEQSINVGFNDYYGPALPEQWLDVTAVPSGTYWLEVVVDPLNRLLESDESNNAVRLQIEFKNPLP